VNLSRALNLLRIQHRESAADRNDLARDDPRGYPPTPFPSLSTAEPVLPQVLKPSARLAAAIVGATLVVLLAIASRLEPDPRGFGTHRQLGLYRCTFEWLVGRPCPSCGMTTSWSHLMHGQPLQSLRANAGGTTLAAVSMIVGPWLLVVAMRGRWWLVVPTDKSIALVALVIAGITVIDWLRRLGLLGLG
jgi:hypothetical protein